MTCAPIKELFQISWLITNKGIHDLQKKGEMSCLELENNFRSFHRECLFKLDDFYLTVRKQAGIINGSEHLQVIDKVKRALCK